MAIETIAGTEHVEGDRQIVKVEVTEQVTHAGRNGIAIGSIHTVGWEFQCSSCGELSTNLTETEAVELIAEHQCPEVEACTADPEELP